ncbi:BrnT family toxin [Candidatus Shapirobacteria bacterium]|nr:BrnT family toxin [Candidatus Shapirobacteria bacterium]
MVYTYIVRLDKSIEFLWDKGNLDKNWLKHQVLTSESEEIFYDDSKIILKDILHSNTEDRFIILGKTKKNRLLFIAFTKRNNKIRIISARNADKKEKKLYEKNA